MIADLEPPHDRPGVSTLLRESPRTRHRIALGHSKRPGGPQNRRAALERTILSPPGVSPLVTQIPPAAASRSEDPYVVQFLDLPGDDSEADLPTPRLRQDGGRFIQPTQSPAPPTPSADPVRRLLTAEFGRGFDASSLRYMRLFFQAFRNCDALRHELSWTHNRSLLRVEDPAARLWYMSEAADQNWNTRALDRQIGAVYYERLLASQDRQPLWEEADAQISVLHGNEHLFANRYKLVLPSEEELRAELVREQREQAERVPGLPGDGHGGRP